MYTNSVTATRALHYSMATPRPGLAACGVICWLLELRCVRPHARDSVVVPFQRMHSASLATRSRSTGQHSALITPPSSKREQNSLPTEQA